MLPKHCTHAYFYSARPSVWEAPKWHRRRDTVKSGLVEQSLRTCSLLLVQLIFTWHLQAHRTHYKCIYLFCWREKNIQCNCQISDQLMILCFTVLLPPLLPLSLTAHPIEPSMGFPDPSIFWCGKPQPQDSWLEWPSSCVNCVDIVIYHVPGTSLLLLRAKVISSGWCVCLFFFFSTRGQYTQESTNVHSWRVLIVFHFIN